MRKHYIIDVIILVHRDQFAIIFNKRGLGALYYSIINRSTVIDDNILYEKSVSIGCLVSEDRARLNYFRGLRGEKNTNKKVPVDQNNEISGTLRA